MIIRREIDINDPDELETLSSVGKVCRMHVCNDILHLELARPHGDRPAVFVSVPVANVKVEEPSESQVITGLTGDKEPFWGNGQWVYLDEKALKRLRVMFPTTDVDAASITLGHLIDEQGIEMVNHWRALLYYLARTETEEANQDPDGIHRIFPADLNEAHFDARE